MEKGRTELRSTLTKHYRRVLRTNLNPHATVLEGLEFAYRKMRVANLMADREGRYSLMDELSAFCEGLDHAIIATDRKGSLGNSWDIVERTYGELV